MRNTSVPVMETVQISVRLPLELSERLNSLCSARGNVERSSLVREAIAEFVEAELPAAGASTRAVKAAWRDVILRAFQDERELWFSLSEASFSDLDPALAPKLGAVHVRVYRDGFNRTGDRSFYDGPIEYEGSVNTPEELYRELRAAIRKQVKVGRGR